MGSLLDEKTVLDSFKQSLTSMKPYWQNFDEFERLARNKPHPKVVAGKLPTVTDGTLAGVISAQPKRVIQQLPTGSIRSVDQPELAEIMAFIWLNHIIPNATYNGTVLQKSWIMLKKALTYGMQPSYAFFKSSSDYFGADFSLPYIKDVILQRGKNFGPDCELLYMRQWYTPEQIKLLIDRENKLKSSAKSRGDELDSSWNVPNLKRALEQAKEKDADAQTPSERNKQNGAPLIEIVHAFQVGSGAKFFSFCPDLPEGKNIVRTKTNPDPRGKMPINFLYAEVDLSNPLGMGYAELSGGMQNLLDSEVQTYQMMTKIMLAPPVMKWGRGVKASTIKYKSSAVWDMGSDPNSKVEPVNINNEAIANFSTNVGLMKSQIFNLTNNQETSVSAASDGGVGQSKTAQGVRQQDARIGTDDNYLRKQFEDWFGDNAESMLNIHFAESKGVREIELTKEYLEDNLSQAASQPAASQPKQVKINKPALTARVDYSEIKTKLKFEVDATSSESPDDEQQVAHLKELLSDVANLPFMYYWLLNDGYELHLGEAYRDLMMRLGVSDMEKIIKKLPKDENGQPIQPPNASMMGPVFDKPKVSVNLKDIEDPAARAAVLQNAGLPTSGQLLPVSPAVAEAAARGMKEELPQEQMPGQPPAGQPPVDPSMAADPSMGAGAPPPAAPPPAADAGPAAPALGPGDQAFAEELLKMGYATQQVLAAIAALHHGYSPEQVIELIGAPGGQRG